MASSQQTSDQRGAGGKFRKESNRSTPYDRPNNVRDSGRIRKNVIDPAIRITRTASQKLFELLFPKNVPRIPSIPGSHEVNRDSRDASPAVVPSNNCGAQGQVIIENGNLNNHSHSSGTNDFEQMITGKTFTRDEAERLIEVLQSKTSDVPDVDEHRRIGTSSLALAESSSGKGTVLSEENERKRQALHATGSAPFGSSSFFEDDVASPAELAKAYMGRGSSKLTPSSLSLHSHGFREDASWKTNFPFTPKSNSTLLGQRIAVPYGSVPRRSENGYATPVSRGRSDIFSMARTPYSRIHHTSALKGVDPMTDGKAGPSTSLQRSWESGEKQTSKRRSSVLDCDIGSIGPIRRTRQKTNMMFRTGKMGLSISKSPLPIPLTPIVSDAEQKQFQVDESYRKTSVPVLTENGENSIAGKRSVGVPSQSIETARKIFEHLEKCVPSPKEKSPESKTTSVVGTSPPKLTSGDYRVIGARSLSSQKQAVVDVDGTSKIMISKDILGSQGHEVGKKLSTKDTVSPTKTTHVLHEKLVSRETASKDSMALESNNVRSRDKSNTSDTDRRNGIADGGESILPSCDMDTTGSLILGKSSDTGAFNEEDIQLADPVTDVTGRVKKVDASTSPPPLNRPSTSGEATGVQFSYASNGVDKVTSFSPASVGCESSGLNAAQSEGKLEAVNSTGTPTNKVSLRSSNNENGDLFRHSMHTIASSSSAPASSTSGISSNMTLSSSKLNGSTTPSVAGSASVPFLDRSTGNAMFPDPSTSTSTIAPITNVKSGSIFQSGFGTSTSAATLNAASVKPPTSGIESTVSEPKTMSTSPFSSLKGSPFGIKPSAFTGSSSSSSSVFGAPAVPSVAFPAVDNQSQSRNTSGSLPGAGSSPFTQSLPKQSDISAPSQTCGLNGSFSINFGGALSVSSAPATNPFESLGSTTPSTSSVFAGFKFGASSAAITPFASPQMASGSALSTSSGSVFSYSSAGNVSSVPVTTWANPFASLSSVSAGNDQMNNEDSTAKPTVSASNPMIPDFGQPSSSSQQSNFVFGAPSSSGGSSVFQFNSQQNPGSFEGTGGGLFTVGTGGGVDKTNRRIFKARRDKLRKR